MEQIKKQLISLRLIKRCLELAFKAFDDLEVKGEDGELCPCTNNVAELLQSLEEAAYFRKLAEDKIGRSYDADWLKNV